MQGADFISQRPEDTPNLGAFAMIRYETCRISASGYSYHTLES